mgnify:CR=1 FL=1
MLPRFENINPYFRLPLIKVFHLFKKVYGLDEFDLNEFDNVKHPSGSTDDIQQKVDEQITTVKIRRFLKKKNVFKILLVMGLKSKNAFHI